MASPPAASSSPWRVLGGLLALVLALVLGWRGLTQPPAPQPPAGPSPTSMLALTPVPADGAPVEHYRTAAWELFLTRPDLPAAQSHRGGPDAFLAQALRAAQRRIDMAAYDLDLWSLRDALLEAHRRGVAVRLVVDEDHHTPEVQALQQAGIPVVFDQGKGLMHHKFVVVDDAEVWTGSMNFTVNGAYRNGNNLIRLTSSRLAADYRREFEEMFAEHRFGPDSRADTPYPLLTLNGVPVEVYFSPDEHPQARLVSLLREAHNEVLLLAYTWTADPLTDALLAQAQDGVAVYGWLEAAQLDAAGHDYPRLQAAGLEVTPDPLPGMLHHKVLVLDHQVVVLGSYNFTRAADVRNDENLLVVRDANLAAAFYAWWQTQRAAWP